MRVKPKVKIDTLKYIISISFFLAVMLLIKKVPTSALAGRLHDNPFGSDQGLAARLAAAWSQQTSGTAATLNGVDCPSSNTCVAVGDAGVIINTTNGGSTWTTRSSGTAQKLYNVSCSSTSSCVTVGDGGTLLTTSNGGNTWTARSSATAERIQGISCPTGTTTCLWAGGNSVNSLIAASSNSGVSWTSLDIGNSALNDVSCGNAGACFTVGQFGRIFGIINQNSVPDNLKKTLVTELFGVDCPTTTNCYSVGQNGKIYATTDGGANWPEKSSGVSTVLREVSCTSTATCFAVGDSGVILTSSDGGTTWTAEISGVPTDLFGVDCPVENKCFAVGVGGTILTQVVPIDINVLGKGRIIASGDTTPNPDDDTDFGATVVSGGQVEHTFTIANAGTNDLILSGSPKVALSGNIIAFSVITQPTSPVPPGQNTTFTIRFAPSTTGLHTATINIISNDPNKNPYTFTLQGQRPINVYLPLVIK